MSQNRRFFVESTAASLLAGAGVLLGTSETANAQDTSQELDSSVLNFWTQQASKPYNDYIHGVSTRGPSWQPAFVFWNSDKNEFHPAERIDTSKLPQSGDMKVSLNVMRFHPSAASAHSIGAVKGGTLRVDVKQTSPLPELSEVLAWSTVAALVPKSGNLLPDLKNLTFDSGTDWKQMQSIPLTSGFGFWNINFFLTPKDSIWSQFVTLFRKADSVVFPLLGLPAIAVAALGAVDKLVGYLQAKSKSDWLFKSVDSPVCATRDALAKAPNGLPFTTGDYLVIPQDQLSAFGNKAPNLKLDHGFLVSKSAGEFDYLSDEVQDVDYLSVHVGVTTDSKGSASKKNG